MSANSVPEILRRKGISAETVKALSALKGEPDWLVEKRLEAWQIFEKTPMPTLREEAWRYTDISDVRIEDFVPYAPSPDASSERDLPEAVQTLIREGEQNSALLVQHNSETAYSRVDEELARKGLVFTDLHTALEEHASAENEELAFSNGAVELFVGEGSSLRYVSLQNWERNVLHFNTIRSRTEKDATINSLVVSLGSLLSRTNVEAGLEASGSDSEMLGLYFADSDQLLDHHTLQDHISPNAHSDLLYKGALRDESLAVFSGLIRVEPGAQKTDAYQTNRNLILGTDEAMAVSLPNLEIMADDVKCSHGSTTGQVDDVELFYLMSRGIPRKEAEKLVVFGFFGEVTSRVPFKGLKEKLDRAIEGKIGLGFEERVA